MGVTGRSPFSCRSELRRRRCLDLVDPTQVRDQARPGDDDALGRHMNHAKFIVADRDLDQAVIGSERAGELLGFVRRSTVHDRVGEFVDGVEIGIGDSCCHGVFLPARQKTCSEERRPGHARIALTAGAMPRGGCSDEL
jgi:hypothetical protein